jgi:N-acetylmuramoyl-L-alanine amidase
MLFSYGTGRPTRRRSSASSELWRGHAEALRRREGRHDALSYYAVYAVFAIALVLVASAVSGQAPPPGGPLIVLSRDTRRPLPTVDVQGHQMVWLDELATLFQLTVREDLAARAVTATYKNQTIVLTPDQSLVSTSGRLVSLPAPLTRQGRRWLVPIEFISRALAPIYDTRLELRPASRLLIVGDLRVPRVVAQYDETPTSFRVTLEVTPKTTPVVAQEQNRLVIRFEADAMDALLPSPPAQQGLLSGIRAIDPNTIQMDLGARFASYRSLPPTSRGAAAVVTIELLAAASESAATPVPAPTPAVPAAPLPVFGSGSRSSIRTIVIDPGHGGEDSGVKGPAGTLEKVVALAVARRLRGVVEGRLGIRVLLTHEDDKNIDADGRAAIANNNKADLFISLHANGSPVPAARGASIFSLSLDRFGEDARRHSQADREVLPVYGGGTREISLVEWELAQAAHVEESNAFAAFVEQKLRDSSGLPSIVLQKAPMRGLAGTNMPAVLFEMGYLSNPDEEKQLVSAEFQNSIAQAVTEAIIAFRDYLDQRSGPSAP